MNVRYKDATPLLLFVFLVLFVNNSSVIKPLSIIFSSLLGVTSFLTFCYLLIKLLTDPKVHSILIFPLGFFLFFGLYVFLSSAYGPSPDLGLRRAFQIFCVLGLFIYSYSLGSKGRAMKFMTIVTSLSFILIVVHFILFTLGVNVSRFKEYSGLLLNPNGFGMWVATMGVLILGLLKKSYVKIIALILVIFLVGASGSRSSLLALMTALGVYFLPERFVRTSFFKFSFLFFIIFFSVAVIYVSLYMDLGIYNREIVELTGKNLQSGRHLIWPAIIDSVSLKPWIGWGSGTNLSDVFDRTYSAHNAFLQTLLQNGSIGLFLMVGTVISVYFSLFEIRDMKHLKLAVAAFSSLLIIQSFEITMFQNNLALSYPVWAILGLLMGHNVFEKRNRAFNEYCLSSPSTSR